MTLPITGDLSLNQIQTEFGGTLPISMNEYYSAGGLVQSGAAGVNGTIPQSGTLDFNVFYGSSKVSVSNLPILETGSLYVTGTNANGVLGIGSSTNITTFTKVGTHNDWSSISLGVGSLGAGVRNGTLWAWGDNSSGALCDGTLISKNSPIQIGTDTDWHSVSCGTKFLMALKQDGTLWAAGHNYYGQLGDGTTVAKSTLTLVGNSYKKVLVGPNTVAALKQDGTLWIWGSNSYGQVGQGHVDSVFVPTKLNDSTWSTFDVAAYSVSAIRSDGVLFLWGNNAQGQLGLDPAVVTEVYSPVQIGSDTDWASVSLGLTHIAALKADKTLWTWGNGASGRLGTNDQNNRSAPVRIGTLSNYRSVACTVSSTLAVREDSTLWACGGNSSGTFGNGLTTNSNVLVQVPGTFWTSLAHMAAPGSGANPASFALGAI